MRRINVLVTLSAVHVQPLAVPEWELPLLQLVHGGQVKIVGESRCDLRVPHPADEYARLMRRYSHNKETLVPRVQEVYGADMVGVRALEQAMLRDLEEQAEIDDQKAGLTERQQKQEAQSTQQGALQNAHVDAARGAAAGAGDPPAASAASSEPTEGRASGKRNQRAGG